MESYKETGKGLSRIDQQRILVQDKKQVTYLTDIHSQVLQDVSLNRKKNLSKKQRQLSNKKKGSNNRKKRVRAVAVKHKHVVNQRSDFQHKLSRQLVDNFDAIGAEDLKIRNMVKNHNLAKSISDGGWVQFLLYLEYKAEEAGKLFIRVNPRNTSRECSTPGCDYAHKDMTLDIMEWTCPKCGKKHNRNVNAAGIMDERLLEKIRQELPEYTLAETGSADDIAGNNNTCALKSAPSLKQEAYQFIDR